MSLGSLVLELQGNLARTQEDMGRMAQVVDNAMRRIDQMAARASASIQGVTRAGGAIGRMKGAEDAARSIDKVAHSSTAARREMLVLAHELSQGNFKKFGGSLLVLGEQMDLMGKIMSPTGLAIGAIAATTAIATEMFIKGAEESAHFAKAITLTGNYAGITEGQFNAMAKRVADAAHASTGAAREITTALIETGRFGPQSLESVATAATLLARVSGEKSEDVVKEFTKMSDGALKWAVEANRQYHFVDGALIEHVAQLEAAGKKEEAFQAVADAVTKAMATREAENVKGFAKTWADLKTSILDALEAMHKFGNAPTPEDHIKSLRAALAVAQAHPETTMGEFGPHDASKRAVQLQKELGQAVSQNRRQQDNTELTRARQAAADQVGVYKAQWKEMLKTAHVGKSELDEELERIKTIGAGSGAPQSEIQALLDKKKKEFADKGAGGVQRAETQATLQPLQRQIEAEEKLLAYRERVLQQYHKADLISDAGYYETRVTVINAAQKRIESLYDQEIAAAQVQAARVTDARAKIEATAKVEDLRNQKQQALLQLQEGLATATFENTQATEKYRDEVTKLNAELDKLRHTTTGTNARDDFLRQNENLLKQSKLGGDTDTTRKIYEGADAAQAQSDLNDQKTKAKYIEDALAQSEARSNLAEEAGQKTRVQNMLDISVQRQRAAQELQVIADRMREVADASGLPELQDQAAALQLHVDELKESSNVLGKTLSTTFSGAFANSLLAVQNRTKSVKDAFLDMANNIEQALLRIVDADIADKLFGTGSGGAGGGGLFAKLVGLAIGAMGGGGGAVAGAVSSDQLSAPDWSSMEGRATGGPVMPSTMYQVNERGPELLTYANKTFLMMGDKGGKVTPLAGGGAGGRGSPIFNMNIAVPAGTSRASAQQQAAEIMRHAQLAQARNA